ncbi:ABC transporter substrate-binding protein [Kibdelosporangium philippinense]|uniref:ABC transporter substrate-binding protein n=1 Tax=Kibdelosporangium philippinense TaxID=211113 RepID=A0ABS8ZA69_9PSEU|nr:ABC transporter substrate-binding protein [Kibdelosporangium philippinense]MCE7004763.1 ABC transporter substrate-binding protein [Kibdelosporangium philippinense]
MPGPGLPRRLIALPCAAVALIAACGNPPASPSEAKQNVKLVDATPAAGPLAQATWFMAKEPSTLDLDNDGAGANSDLILSNVCERLVQLQPDLTIKPGIAEKYEWTSPNTLTFTIRSGVTFHSGAKLTADDVVWSLQRHAADGANESDEFTSVTSIAKTADNQVTVTLKAPDAVFLQAMAGDGGAVLERKGVEQQGAAYGTPRGKDACSGPFTLQAWNSGQNIVISKFAQYWDSARAAKTEKITFRWADDDALVNSLVTGAGDGTYLENISSATRLATGGTTSVSQGPDTRVWSLMVTERGALTDVRLRKALSLAIDRDGVSRAALAGFGAPAKEPVGPGAWGYQATAFQAAYDQLGGSPAIPSEQDIEAAKKLVAEVPDRKPIIVASDTTDGRSVIANALVDAAKKIGLEASIIQIPPQQYTDYYSSKEFRAQADLFTDDYFISKNDPVGFYKNGSSKSTVQWVLKDPQYDSLVAKARAALDDAERAKLSIELASKWADAMPWISVVQSPSTVALSNKVTGVPASGCYRYYPWAADLGAKGA